MAESETTKSSPLLIILFWAIVVLPTGWGFSYTLQNAMKIFTAPASALTAPATPTAAPTRGTSAVGP